jgi:hypothetical protein
MNELVFRNAVSDDIPFLVNTIIEAEKSGTDKLTYSTVFGLTDGESAKYIGDMLSEEIDGCELSVSSFLIAEKEGKTAGALSSWIEGSTGVSSSLLKANLLKYVLPEHCFFHMMEINPIIQELNIEYIDNTFQLGAGFVPQEYRGDRILSKLIAEAIRRLSIMKPDINEIYAQIYSTNIPSIRSAEKEGFSIVLEKESLDHRIFEYLPSNRKVLVKKVLSTNN